MNIEQQYNKAISIINKQIALGMTKKSIAEHYGIPYGAFNYFYNKKFKRFEKGIVEKINKIIK